MRVQCSVVLQDPTLVLSQPAGCVAVRKRRPSDEAAWLFELSFVCSNQIRTNSVCDLRLGKNMMRHIFMELFMVVGVVLFFFMLLE